MINNYLNSFFGSIIMCKKLIFLVSLILVLSIAGNGWAGTSKPIPANGAIHEDTWINLGWEGTGVSYDVYFGDNLDSVKDGTEDTFQGNQTTKFFVAGFPGFAFPDGLIPGTTYYWRIDETQADGTVQTGSIWSFSILAKTANNPKPADGAEFVDPNNVVLNWTPGFGAKLHTVYIGTNFDEVNNAAGGSTQAATTFSPGPLEPEKVYYWRVDEFDATETYKGDVWSFTTPGAVGNPQPTNGATDMQMNKILSWTPADSAASHELYFGTDKDTVRTAGTGSPEYIGPKTLGVESYDPGLLEPDAAHYWRVDEVDSQGNVSKGPLWGFTTGDFLLVEGFESYSDDDAAGEAIWQHWIDGLDVSENGAQVGYLLPSYAEQSIVRGGLQSMPLLYMNTNGVMYSEAELTLGDLRDWTVKDVNTLTLSFWGKPANAAEPMYVTLNGSSPIYRENPNASQIPIWSVWNIDLQVFADQGVDLTNVNKIAIGFGDKNSTESGGSGTVYIDDIRLGKTAHPVLKRSLPFLEDFETVELGTSPEESAGTQGVWTDTPPEGWFIDESGIPGIGDPETDGVADWAGWAITDKDWWIQAAGDQRRTEFTLGQGAVAVADPDEWDDLAHTDSASEGWYKTFMSTPVIDISEVQAGTIQLKFDSSWRPEFDGDYHQTANITAFFNDQDPVEILLWESDGTSPNFKDDNSTNETITVDLENPQGATSLVLTFGLFEAGNDWWWAIDNIVITGSPE
jgi:hypothetical protein